MNINKFTQKSIEAVNGCEAIAREYGNQQIEQEHLLLSLLRLDDSLIAKLLERMNVPVEAFTQNLQQLVERGNTVVAVEHRLEMIAAADWIIDMGPEGGNRGGQVIFTGTPKQLLTNNSSFTAKHLRRFQPENG